MNQKEIDDFIKRILLTENLSVTDERRIHKTFIQHFTKHATKVAEGQLPFHPEDDYVSAFVAGYMYRLDEEMNRDL